MKQAPLKQERSDYGKLHRKAYEAGSREFGGRCMMKQHVPKFNGKSETITTVLIDNLIIELYERTQSGKRNNRMGSAATSAPQSI